MFLEVEAYYDPDKDCEGNKSIYHPVLRAGERHENPGWRPGTVYYFKQLPYPVSHYLCHSPESQPLLNKVKRAGSHKNTGGL